MGLQKCPRNEAHKGTCYGVVSVTRKAGLR
jgi:hypothetical protein